VAANRIGWKGGSSSGYARFERGACCPIKVHERVIAIEDYGLNFHGWRLVMLCSNDWPAQILRKLASATFGES
jgi:hypothetical protein